MANLKRRLERLEEDRKGIPLIMVKPGETKEEAWQRHLAKYPENKNPEMVIYIKR